MPDQSKQPARISHARRWWLGFFIWSLLALSLRADTALPGRMVSVPFDSEYLVDAYGFEEGFPGNTCTGIGQTPDGYLWFSSFSGLARFNTREFTVVSPENQPALPDSRAANCYTDRRGRLFVGTIRGLAMKSGNSWTNFPESRRWGESEIVRNYAEGAKGELFISTSRGNVFRIRNEKLEPLPTPPGTGGAYCAVDADGYPFIVRGSFVGAWNGSRWNNFTNVESAVAQAVGAGQARDGGAWLILTNRAVLIRDGQVTRELPLTETVTGGFWQLLEDSHGTIWLPAVDHGVIRITTNGVVKRLGRAAGLPNNSGTRAVFEDKQGSLWIGCGAGGVVRLRPARFHTLNSSGGLPDVLASSVAAMPDGQMLIGTYGGGLFTFSGRRPIPKSVLPTEFIQSTIAAADGTLFVGTSQNGLFQISNNVSRLVNGANRTLPLSITALLEDSSRRLWVGNKSGIGFLSNGVYQAMSRPKDWQIESVFITERTNDRSIFVGNMNHLFAANVASSNLNRIFTLPENNRITALLTDSRQRMWIGTAKSGLYVLAENRLVHLQPQLNLPPGGIGGLIEDDSGNLWFDCGHSLICANTTDLWQLANETNRPAIPRRIFNQRDGLGIVDISDSFQPTTTRDAQGRLWFAMLHGVVMMDSAQLPSPSPMAPLVVESFEYFSQQAGRAISQSLTEKSTALILPPDSARIKVSCALLDYNASEKERYRFRLDGDDNHWQDNGDDHFISLYQVSPGEHLLHIQAVGENGEWCEPVQLAFTVQNYFWRTSWFWVLSSCLLVAATGALTWWLASLRVKQTRRLLEQERRLAEVQTRLGSVLENTSDFVGFADAQGKIFYLNHAGRNLIGLDDDTPLTSLAMEDLYPAWVRKLHAPLWLPGGQKVWAGESALHHRDGREIPISQVIITHRKADGTLDFSSTISRDISAAKQNERIREALRHLASVLTRALKPDEIGRTVAYECQKIFQHDAFFFVMLDRNGKISHGGYWEDTLPGAALPVPTVSATNYVSPALHSVIAGQNLLINREPSELAAQQPLNRFGEVSRPSASLMYAPITWEGQTIGMMSVQSYTPQRYNLDGLALLRSFADQCGPVVARLFVEEKLRQNEERLRLAMDATRLGSWEIRLADQRLAASDQAEKIYGYPPGTMHGDIRCLTEKNSSRRDRDHAPPIRAAGRCRGDNHRMYSPLARTRRHGKMA